jgi:hypothetical protein
MLGKSSICSRPCAAVEPASKQTYAGLQPDSWARAGQQACTCLGMRPAVCMPQVHVHGVSMCWQCCPKPQNNCFHHLCSNGLRYCSHKHASELKSRHILSAVLIRPFLLQSSHHMQSEHQAPSAAASQATAASQALPLAACAPLAPTLRVGPWRTASPASLVTQVQWVLSLHSSVSPLLRRVPSGSGHQAVQLLLHSACATQVRVNASGLAFNSLYGTMSAGPSLQQPTMRSSRKLWWSCCADASCCSGLRTAPVVSRLGVGPLGRRRNCLCALLAETPSSTCLLAE